MKVQTSIQSFGKTIERDIGYRRIVDNEPIPDDQKVIRGRPCPRSIERKTFRAKAMQMIGTLASKKVPLSIVEMRNTKCEECRHCTKIDERLFCECCNCPKWRLANCKVKNQYQKHFCPLGFFGVYEGWY